MTNETTQTAETTEQDTIKDFESRILYLYQNSQEVGKKPSNSDYPPREYKDGVTEEKVRAEFGLTENSMNGTMSTIRRYVEGQTTTYKYNGPTIKNDEDVIESGSEVCGEVLVQAKGLSNISKIVAYYKSQRDSKTPEIQPVKVGMQLPSFKRERTRTTKVPSLMSLLK